jgi:hypothetical protein
MHRPSLTANGAQIINSCIDLFQLQNGASNHLFIASIFSINKMDLKAFIHASVLSNREMHHKPLIDALVFSSRKMVLKAFIHASVLSKWRIEPKSFIHASLLSSNAKGAQIIHSCIGLT